MAERELTLYTDGLRRAIESIPEDHYLLNEMELRDKVNPSWKLYQLKESFWGEFARAETHGAVVRNSKIYENIYSKAYFYDIVLKNKAMMAWLMTPLTEYDNKARAALHKATDRYDELINMEITSERKIKDPESPSGFRTITEVDPKKAIVLLQVIKNLEERVKGSAIQRQVSINTNQPSDGGGEEHTLDMSAVEKRMKELEQKLNPFDKEEDDDKGNDEQAGVDDGIKESIATESRRVDPVDR